ncbi:DNA-binding transcriptional ArsR family regulator [Rhodococcus sp. LBL1]|uniref:DNA-binding transcriptional ArsR family regulator n=1 Tax=Prescottella agglutinans TaxID=1644129 RepID=A0ABT6MCH6_9NOCA|nr:metalloregulator ArsR/SmtB family transcription factor [Prescottella agglutinans]MDH6282013.1 DNA-binding transcriptional ArsR family regulator [Prescottella agglutinans]MDH6677632.1 DNA-binding transcriptional ArsR family regulator [Rhodococcus sp. LBL1]MDH6683219.1 DNA-binding transcriptional ArsR family regulator [Rhodococcus sp. LBL2]
MPDDVFLALANPARRRLLELLVDGPRTAGDLAAEFDMSRPAVAEHLQVLRRAELVDVEPVGRQRFYRLATEPLESVSEWLHPFERFWRTRLRHMADLLEKENLDD